MKYVVIGAGIQGRGCAFDLLRAESAKEVVLIDNLEENLHKSKKWLESQKLKRVVADAANPKSLLHHFKGADAVVSCAPYEFNLELAKCAIEAGTHFIDLGGDTTQVRKELDLSKQAAKKGISIVPDAGVSPGITNILVGHGMSLFEEVDEILIRDGVGDNTFKPLGLFLRKA